MFYLKLSIAIIFCNLNHYVNSINDSLINPNDHLNHSKITLIDSRWDVLGKHIVYALFLLAAAAVKIGYNNTRYLRTQVPESCVLILLGTLVGFLVYINDAKVTQYIPIFTPHSFFYLYLPPIILESAYTLYNRTFFRNIGTILLLAIVGTLINIFAIGISIYYCFQYFNNNIHISITESLTFSTLISAVDPIAVIAIFQEVNVNKLLYFLVFGESLFNDAVVITMYNTMTTFAALETIEYSDILMSVVSFGTVTGGGVLIGIIYGALTSIFTRFTENTRVMEPLLIIGFAYASYISGELFHFSGIISLVCCGLLQTAYAWHNISRQSSITIKYMVKTLSSISDVIIFLFLGMILVCNKHYWDTLFVIFTLIFCLIYRFFSIYLLLFVANNFFPRIRLINKQEQFLLAYGGLRGAIAFALAVMLRPDLFKQCDLFISTTLVIIIFTVFVQGSTTKPIVKLLSIQKDVDSKTKLLDEINIKTMDVMMQGIFGIVGEKSIITFLVKYLRIFNEKYLTKILVKGNLNSFSTIKAAHEEHFFLYNLDSFSTKSNTKLTNISMQNGSIYPVRRQTQASLLFTKRRFNIQHTQNDINRFINSSKSFYKTLKSPSEQTLLGPVRPMRPMIFNRKSINKNNFNKY